MFRHKLQLFNRTTSVNALGEAVSVTVPVGTVWGTLSPASSAETAPGERPQEERQYLAKIRRVAALRSGGVVEWGARRFEILWIKEDPEFSRDLLLKVSEIVER